MGVVDKGHHAMMRRPTAIKMLNVDKVNEASIERVFEQLMAESGLKLGAIAQPARVALTGGMVSPGIHEIMAILGRQRVLSRLRQALEWIVSSASHIP